MRFEIDRLGVELCSCSSVAPSEVRDDFLRRAGEEAGLFRLILLDERRDGGRGDFGCRFIDAVDVRRDNGVRSVGVGGAETRGL